MTERGHSESLWTLNSLGVGWSIIFDGKLPSKIVTYFLLLTTTGVSPWDSS